MLNRKAPSRGQKWRQKWSTTGVCAATNVHFLETLKLKLHCDTAVVVQLPRVYVEDILDTNLLCRPSMLSHLIRPGRPSWEANSVSLVVLLLDPQSVGIYSLEREGGVEARKHIDLNLDIDHKPLTSRTPSGAKQDSAAHMFCSKSMRQEAR